MKTYDIIFDRLFQEKDFVTGEKLAKELGLSRTAIWKAIKTLESKGIVIESVKNKGYRLMTGDLLIPELIQQATGLPVHYNPKSLSTQLDAKEGIEFGNQGPSLYLAPSQTKAKGRFGRPFFTDKQGGIYMSLHLHPNCLPTELPPYTLMVASCIVKAIQQLTQLTPKIKWVNDIYLDKKKIAGILTEAITSVETGLVTDVIIGVGLNFSIREFPVELHDKASSLFTDTAPITRNQLISQIWTIFKQSSEKDLVDSYQAESLVLGKEVTFMDKGELATGQAISISPKGNLTIKRSDGSLTELVGGEVILNSW